MTTQTDVDVNKEVKTEAPKEQEFETLDPLELIAQQVEAARQVEEPKEAEVKQEPVEAKQNDVILIDDPSKYRLKRKIEGQEEEISLSDVLASHQKNEVASRRLNEATRIKAEAEALLAKAKTAQVEPKEDSEKSTLSVDDDAVKIAKTAINSILDGNEEEAAIALAQLTAGRGNSTQSQNVDANQIATAVKQQLEVDSVLAEFEGKYSDLMGDTYLANLTNENLKQVMESGQHTDFRSALEAAGEKTRGWLKSITGNTQTTTTTTPKQERVALKAGLEQMPRVTASSASLEEPVPSALDIINEMKKDRGFVN